VLAALRLQLVELGSIEVAEVLEKDEEVETGLLCRRGVLGDRAAAAAQARLRADDALEQRRVGRRLQHGRIVGF
jgi:hypothetical protein